MICLAIANEETENLLDAAAFARMKPDAFFINMSRGNLVDEAALARALEEGRIAGAAMDVGRAPDQMPSPELARLPNVIATPHIGGLDATRQRKPGDGYRPAGRGAGEGRSAARRSQSCELVTAGLKRTARGPCALHAHAQGPDRRSCRLPRIWAIYNLTQCGWYAHGRRRPRHPRALREPRPVRPRDPAIAFRRYEGYLAPLVPSS